MKKMLIFLLVVGALGLAVAACIHVLVEGEKDTMKESLKAESTAQQAADETAKRLQAAQEQVPRAPDEPTPAPPANE